MTSVPFNNARGSASLLQMSPPFAFSDVTMSVFPLRASLPTLNNFCRNYLDQAPNLVQFKPFIPFVYLVILDYGRMSVEAANMGWISQREVAFGVPMRWMNANGSQLEFHDWAFTSPFIFVDNELSMSTGREVYGWPKLLARLDPSVSEWVRDPHGARRVFQVSTKGTDKSYSGQTSDYRSLLSVYQHRTAGLLDIPQNLDAITKPLSQMSSAAVSMARMSMDLGRTFLGLASEGITGSSVLPDFSDIKTFQDQLDPDRMKSWLSAGNWGPGIKEALWSMFPRMYANTINFKQFRDAANPDATCYQAITSAQMPVDSVKSGGFLGPQNMLLGQLDGGFHIEIHDVPHLPIVDSLGLEVSSQRSIDGVNVSTLVPVAPMWMKVDMHYGLAETVIWRGREGQWQAGKALAAAREAVAKRKAERQPAGDTQTPAKEEKHKIAETTAPPNEGAAVGIAEGEPGPDGSASFSYLRTLNNFNTARGASEAVGGSFWAEDASVRVLPLKADLGALQKFVRSYLEVDRHMKFDAWGDFVYLVVAELPHLNSLKSGRAARRAREMSFLVPVKAYTWHDQSKLDEIMADPDATSKRERYINRGSDHLVTTGFVNAFTFVDDFETAITANEVFGVPTMGASIQESGKDWLNRSHGNRHIDEGILKIHTQVLPELMAGAGAMQRKVVEITGERDHVKEKVNETREETINRWIGLLVGDLCAKRLEANGPDLLVERDTDSRILTKREREEFEQKKIAVKLERARQRDANDVAQSFAMQLLAGQISFNQFSLKQFRDSANAHDACYQGLVQRQLTIRKLKDLHEMPGPLHVTITDFPTQEISSILGLRPKYRYLEDGRQVNVFEPIRPFSLNGDVERGQGKTLYERVGNDKWKQVDQTDLMFGWRSVSRSELDDMATRAEEYEPAHFSFEEQGEQPDQVVKKIARGIDAAGIRGLYNKSLKSSTCMNVYYDNRDRKDAILSIRRKRLDGFDPKGTADLAAWVSHQFGAGETMGRKPREAAEMIERLSPATVVDQVLARQWGKADGGDFGRDGWADFCVPVSTVPRDFATVLFTEAERQGGFWPQSSKSRNDNRDRRRQRVSSYRFELEKLARWLGQMQRKSPAAGKVSGEAQRDAISLVNECLPEELRIGADGRGLKFFAEDEISSEVWAKAGDAIGRLQGSIELPPTTKGDEKADFNRHLDRLKYHADKNRLDMQMLEAAAGEDGFADLNDDEKLARRLRRVMTAST